MKKTEAVPSGKKAVKFKKMHGLGNDYVYLVRSENHILDNMDDAQLSELARKISDRHRGVGGDGMVIVSDSSNADFRMRMWNADGSEAQMCGNASRCVGKLLYDFGFTDKLNITLETKAGVKKLTLHPGYDGLINSVTVDMGSAEFDPIKIPVSATSENLPISFDVETKSGLLRLYAIGMGNPHGVCFVSEITDVLVLGEGPVLETHPAWPQKANIEFARILDRSNIEMRVWERGTGETLACGTGACASAAAAYRLGLADNKVKVSLRGGTLDIIIDPADAHILMSGSADFVAEGTYYF